MSNNFFHEAKLRDVPVDEQLRDECLQFYDRDGDGSLNLREFGCLCRDLLADPRGRSYPLQIRVQADMFYVFDSNRDGRIDENEFRALWADWASLVLAPVSALLVVDVQNDFISGTLAIKRCEAAQEGSDVIPVINSMLQKVPFDHVVYSLDWHTPDHISFVENVGLRPLHPACKVSLEEVQPYDTVLFQNGVEQKLWPAHCVQGSWGAELHGDLEVAEGTIFVKKGTNPEIDSYSAFWDNQKLSETELHGVLKKRNVNDVFVCGLATDVCVSSSARHALEYGYRTILVDDASRGLNTEDMAASRKNLTSQNALVVDSGEVMHLVTGMDRRPEPAYRAAMLLASKSTGGGTEN